MLDSLDESRAHSFNVCIMGASLETGNRGVSALSASLIKIISTIKPDANISLLVGHKKPKVRKLNVSGREIRVNLINYRLAPNAKLKEHLLWILLMAIVQRITPSTSIRKKIVENTPFLRALKLANFVGDIHGGDSFSDIYGMRRFIIGGIPDIIAILMKKKIVLLPQTYGPYQHLFAKKLAAFIISRSNYILTRDKQGDATIGAIIRAKRAVTFCPDVGFLLDAANLDNPQIVPALRKNADTRLIGININGLMYNGGYTRENMFALKFDYRSFIQQLVNMLLLETNAELLFVPHTFGPSGNVNSDPDASKDVVSAMPGSLRHRVHMVIQEYDQSELKGIISKCDFFIGSRMHACIAALSQGIPTIGIAYSKKFIGVFESVGAGNTVMDARIENAAAILKKIGEDFSNREKISSGLRENVSMAQEKIRSVFREVISAQ